MNRLLLILFFLGGAMTFAQESDDLYDHGLDQDKWQDIRDGIRYEGQDGPGREWTYESQEEYEREREKYESGDGGGSDGNSGGYGSGDGASDRPSESSEYTPPPDPPPSFNPSAFSGLGFLFYIFLILFAAALIFLIYYLFVNSERKGAKIDGTEIGDFEDVNPTEIPLTELQRLLQEALARKDYRGAIRIYFIFIIRDLAEKRWIHWEKEKTNFHYLREMSGKREFEDFNISVSYFEFIWYGKREIDAEKFEEIKPKFTRFLDQLGVE